ncbi:very short patch repair endonuclease [Fusibacter sp. A2]|nr:very short patch repair endonuclease [Fusibacter sp. A2]
MSHIHGKDTSIELKVRKHLWHTGFRYRKNYKELPRATQCKVLLKR